MQTGSANAYSEWNFYTTARDQNGDREKITFYVPPWELRKIMEMVAMREFPKYESISDFYRDAAVHRIHWLEDNASSPQMGRLMQSLMDMWDLRADNDRWDDLLNERDEQIARTQGNIERMIENKMWGSLEQLISRQRALIENWTGEHYIVMDKILDEAEEAVKRAGTL